LNNDGNTAHQPLFLQKQTNAVLAPFFLAWKKNVNHLIARMIVKY